MRGLIVIAAATLLLAGCAGGRPITATTYGPVNLLGGYKDKEIEPGVWRVTGLGNGIAGEGFGRNVAVYRAAELIKAQGFSHFQVLRQKGRMNSISVGGGPGSFSGESMEMDVRGTNDPTAPLACRDKTPTACMTLAVDEILARVGPQLTFRKGHAPAQ